MSTANASVLAAQGRWHDALAWYRLFFGHPCRYGYDEVMAEERAAYEAMKGAERAIR